MMISYEDRFFERLAGGDNISQDEYDQMCQDMPMELIAEALARRFRWTEDINTLIHAAQLYYHAGMLYEAVEICSRHPRVYALRKLVEKILPEIRKEYQDIYPDTRLVGRLLDQAFVVIDLSNGQVTRFPPLMPST